MAPALLGLGTLAIMLGAALTFFHIFIVPLPMAADMLLSWDGNKTKWEYKLEHHRKWGDIGDKYESWAMKSGQSYSQARYWEEYLWSNWDQVIVMAGAAVLVFFFAAIMIFGKSRGHRRRHQRHC